jgi:hypothetical protein
VPRQNRRRDGGPDRPLFGGSEQRVEWRGEVWVVRTITGQAAAKAYRCPGCLQEIRPGTPHVVAWPAEDAGADDRRHWHRACWDARDRRPPRS